MVDANVRVTIGFTGTQKGMRDLQQITLAGYLAGLKDSPDRALFVEFRHGDCMGSDAEAHEIAIHYVDRIVIHPPSDPKKRAWKGRDHRFGWVNIVAAKPYHDRNHDLVDQSNWLIATPGDQEWRQPRSGTWATIRYAVRRGKPVMIIYPDGSIERRGPATQINHEELIMK